MAKREGDGSIEFVLSFDGSKMMKSINSSCQRLQQKFEQSFNQASKSATKFADETNEKINQIADDMTRSEKSRAASIAAIYRKEGMSVDEAWTKAWTHIDRDGSSTSKSVKKSIKSLFTQSKKTASGMETVFSNSFSSISKKAIITFATAFSVRQLVNFGKSCINLGSDLQEVQNVVDVTFQTMSDKLDKFAQSAITTAGLSETMAKKYTGTLGSMAKAFGFTESAAYDMSTTLTQLAGDVASFYNLTQDEAYTKLKSVFTGETESLKDLGVVMTQASLDAYALANGFGKTIAKMSEAEKVALRYQFVMDQLSAASGDFQRTSGSWANQVRVLNLQFESLKSTIGQGLINLFTPVIKVVNTLIGKLQVLANSFKSFTELITGNKASASAGLSSVATAASDLASETTGVGTAAKKAAKELRALMGFDEINKLSSNDIDTSESNGISTVPSINFGNLASGETVIEQIDSKFQKLFERLRANIAPLAEQLNRFGNIAKGAFEWLLNNVLVPLANFTITEIVPRFFESLANVMMIVNNVLIALQPLWQWFWDKVLLPVATWTGGIFLSVWDTINGALKKFADWCLANPKIVESMAIVIGAFFAAFKITSLISGIAKLIGSFGGIIPAVVKIGGLIGSVLNPWTIAIGAIIAIGVLLWKNWDTISVKAVEIWTSIQATFQRFDSWLSRVFKKDWTENFGAFGHILNGLFADVQNMWNSVKTIFNGITTFVSGVFTGNWKKAWTGVKDTLRGIFNLMVSQLKIPINMIIGLINSLLSKSVSGINSLTRAMNKISFSIPDWVPGIGGKKFGFNIPQISAPRIPYLADGGFVKRNTPQLAMIGDNRHYGEIVAPEDKLLEMAKMAAQMSGGGSEEVIALLKQIISLLTELLNDDGDIVLMIGDEEIARANKRGSAKLNRRYATTYVKIGG